ncbi:glycerophosphodiester phosphodiesterase [Pedobacter panaciterrae]|jgi:glycerophosphoryl diester phosphodiesterase|uniref:glycerophosphodiester phosphodiesterase n=1 Tax=Pedobacter panaciterrae TaxID=363849 RepID=UPI00155D88C6|nr:glycerophosphodiester phosphodiesterase family protein [Pedobacter panaciterrae]NQX55579.1 glycerophosphodiester phosphodiesterase [Pedobacter panaciterrae]
MKSSILVITLMAVFTKSFDPEPKAIVKGSSWNNNPVIAHRGAWKKNNLPENSIASLKEAIRLGCYGSEFDVHMTSDSVLVINHDPDFYGLHIAQVTYKELLTKKHPNGENIPTLEAYLKEGIKQKKMKLILEIKPSKADPERDQKLTDRAVAMVKKLKAKEWVDYISFSYDVLKRVLELDPKAKVAYLNGDASLDKLKADGFYGADYHYSVYQKGEWFAKAKELGLTINAWTVNNAEDMKWLLKNKVEFITTNEPELAFETIKATQTENK